MAHICIYTFFYGEQQEVFLRLAIESLGHMILQSVSQRKLRNRKNERGWREEKERCFFFFFLASFLILTSLYLLQVGPSWVFLGGTLESLECLCRNSFLSFTGRVQCIEGQVSEGPWWHHRTTKTHLFLERSIGYFQAFHWERVSNMSFEPPKPSRATHQTQRGCLLPSSRLMRRPFGRHMQLRLYSAYQLRCLEALA